MRSSIPAPHGYAFVLNSNTREGSRFHLADASGRPKCGTRVDVSALEREWEIPVSYDPCKRCFPKGINPMKDANHMPREELLDVMLLSSCGEIECDGIIVVPTHTIHESGYRVMDFVVTVTADRKPVGRISGIGIEMHDVFELKDMRGTRTQAIGNEPVRLPEWKCDCLQASGFLYITPSWGRMRVRHDTATVHVCLISNEEAQPPQPRPCKCGQGKGTISVGPAGVFCENCRTGGKAHK